jgi:hypothetical protein
MSIPVDDTLMAIYYLSGHEQDWMAGISRDGDDQIVLRYRFRYYDPKHPHNDAFSGHDRKNWYEVRSKAPLESALASLQGVMDELQKSGYVPKGGLACKLVRGSMTTEKFYEEFSKLPFVHTREMSTDEARKEGYIP